MGKIFGYDSKLMRFLGKVTDLIFLNVIYLLCCIPIFTIGAAQAGLYTAVRAMRDDEDYVGSCYTAFFDGFKNGFGRVTVANLIIMIVMGVMTWNLALVYYFSVSTPTAPVWLSIASLVIAGLFQTLVPLFHSKFGCTTWQLIRNAGYLIICNPIASLILVVLMWAPIIVFLVDTTLFITITPLWLLGYYAIAAAVGVHFFRTSFRILEKNFYESQAAQEEAETEPEVEAEEEE
jgi:uncharacterized membrane protein YesL